jgi:hypothetical protein
MLDVGIDFSFPPHSSTMVTLGAADPNFFSKTMMIPLSMLWKQVRSLTRWSRGWV